MLRLIISEFYIFNLIEKLLYAKTDQYMYKTELDFEFQDQNFFCFHYILSSPRSNLSKEP